MRLLNTSTLQLESFDDGEIPAYAILSHTWGEEEISFQDMQVKSPRVPYSTTSRLRKRAGYVKVQNACRVALENCQRYIWIDTCCIDKTSSAELSEAINSMYKWYREASICYTYLSDVPYSSQKNAEAHWKNSHFAKSRWFTRGWTLQELIAPSDIIFFSQEWLPFGTKASLKVEISEITGIEEWVLGSREYARSRSIAKRMSWASKRETTRKEDMAYCLMGLFDVNMPLLYGEGEKAFIRLQEEIMRQSSDQSLFAWNLPRENGLSKFTGLLASTPAYFSASGNIVPISRYGNQVPHGMTNQGLRIDITLIRLNDNDQFLAPLDCTGRKYCIGPEVIVLVKVSGNNGQYLRLHDRSNPTFIPGIIEQGPLGLFTTSRMQSSQSLISSRMTIFVPQQGYAHSQVSLASPIVYRFRIEDAQDTCDHGYRRLDSTASLKENGQSYMDVRGSAAGIAGAILYSTDLDRTYFTLTVGVDAQFHATARLEALTHRDDFIKVYRDHQNRLDRDVSKIFNPGNSEAYFQAENETVLNERLAMEFTSIPYLALDNFIIEATVRQERIGEEEMYVIKLKSKSTKSVEQADITTPE